VGRSDKGDAVAARDRINLCFHGVGTPERELEPGESDYWIEPDLFEQVLDLVRDRRDVRLSFDDGNASDVAIAAPALRRRSLRAEFFPVADRIGKAGSVDRAGLRELVASGMTIGSHGMRHLPWSTLPDDELHEELAVARTIISAASGTRVTSAACPLGRYDRRVLTRLRRLGYARVYTSDRSRVRASAWLQARYTVRRHDDVAAVRSVLDCAVGPLQSAQDALRTTVKRWR
jgi:peptidoglycan/xylan/chitin deacetylase (PgdA/CDA1 family)